jgi:hypothetical protein
MRLFAVLVAVCALSLPAIAQTPDCTAAPDVDGLLACRDKPPSAGKPTMSKSAEDARMNAQLKNICRGC